MDSTKNKLDYKIAIHDTIVKVAFYGILVLKITFSIPILATKLKKEKTRVIERIHPIIN